MVAGSSRGHPPKHPEPYVSPTWRRRKWMRAPDSAALNVLPTNLRAYETSVFLASAIRDAGLSLPDGCLWMASHSFRIQIDSLGDD